MLHQGPNALKDPEHRKNVYISLVSIALMFVCYWLCIRSMNEHWETRYQMAFLVMGACYMMTALCMAFDGGFRETPSSPD